MNVVIVYAVKCSYAIETDLRLLHETTVTLEKRYIIY